MEESAILVVRHVFDDAVLPDVASRALHRLGGSVSSCCYVPNAAGSETNGEIDDFEPAAALSPAKHDGARDARVAPFGRVRIGVVDPSDRSGMDLVTRAGRTMLLDERFL